MLGLAVRAGIPLITCRTSDLPNFNRLLALTTKRNPVEVAPGDFETSLPKAIAGKASLFWSCAEVSPRAARMLLPALKDSQITMVLVNQANKLDMAFDVGELRPDKRIIEGFLRDNQIPKPKALEILPGLSGLTLKESLEVVMLAEANSRRLTLDSVLEIRRNFFSQSKGVELVDTSIPFYHPYPPLENYLAWAKPYLLGDSDPRLRPRGILLDGIPGTGKSLAAKHIARACGLPLLRLDLGGVKGKYVGESEQGLSDAIRHVEREAPCVLLLDEGEKLFQRAHDEGTTNNLLANLLWWLANHSARVLTVMTTNDARAIPPELTRTERFDAWLVIPGLDESEAEIFALNLAETFLEMDDSISDRVCAGLVELFIDCKHVAHSDVTGLVKKIVRDIEMADG